MNPPNNNLFTVISKTETTKLTTVVNETLAFGLVKEKSFTNADLWNIQRQRKSTLQRRHYA
jgi:hypothetical protein